MARVIDKLTSLVISREKRPGHHGHGAGSPHRTDQRKVLGLLV